MSEPTTTTASNLTPPIRSVAAEASSIIPSNNTNSVKSTINPSSSENKLHQRSASSSSFSSTTSSVDSLAFSTHQNENHDVSSNSGASADWLQLEARLHTLERLSKSIKN
jgi:hypothetical protein